MGKFTKIIILCFLTTGILLATSKDSKLDDYKKSDLSVEVRVNDLLSKMTLEEKVELVGGNDFKSHGNKRLGIPEMIMTDGPLGPNTKGHSTNYSAMINMAATFNPTLMKSIAEQMGEETRVMGRNMLLGPCINIARAPHCGRTFEGFGEDPYLMSQMVVPYVIGVQSRRVITCTKHFVANNQEWNRFDVSAEVDERALREIHSDKPHRRLMAKMAADQSIILLKNENNFLPLNREKIKTIAVIGPNGGEARMLTRVEKDINFDWGYSSPDTNIIRLDKWSARYTGKFKSPGEGWFEIGLRSDNGIRMYLDGQKILDAWIDARPGKFKIARFKFEKDKWYDLKIDFYENIGTCRLKLGFGPYEPGSMTEDAVKLAAKSDVVVLAMGLDKELEGEAVDRARLELDVDQLDLIHKVLKVNKNTVMVLNNATPILMNSWMDKTPAIVEALYPGQEGGNALADILFGDISPSGKLPLTFPKKWEDTPVADSYPGTKEVAHYNEGIYVGYRWYDKKNIEPLYPFGFGLSYTTFEYSDLKLSSKKMKLL